MKTIKRDRLIEIVREAAVGNLHQDDLDDVLYFVSYCSRVVAGAWSMRPGPYASERCYCPVSGACVDRFEDGAQQFAFKFDNLMGVTLESQSAVIFEVVD